MRSPLTSERDYFFSIPDPETINPEIFEGFEIYYKFFDPQTVDENLGINGDTSLSSPVSEQSLSREGYVRLASTTETGSPLPRYPLIPVTNEDMNDEDTQIKLEFSNLGDNSPRSVYGNIIFMRTLRNEAGTRVLKSFSDFDTGDSDLPQGFDPEESFDIVIALYVMSYGNDFERLSFNIYSTAVFLGNSLINLSQ